MKIIIIPKLKEYRILAITIFPFIFVRDKSVLEKPVNLNHEMIHSVQQKEMWLIFFYLFYYIEYLVRGFKNRGDWSKAYYQISFEREAYENEKDLEYLKKRNSFSWVDYLKN